MPKFIRVIKLNSKLNRALLTRTMLTGAVCLWPSPKSFGALAAEKTAVKVTTERGQGGTTHFFVENSELSEVTMTFDFSLQNLKANEKFPYTATFPPGKTEAFTFEPVKPDAQWQYSFTNYYKLGSSVAVPDDYVYSLPYLPGNTFKITQGYDGKFSHQGSNKYALDWKMPQG